jgi:hypothetical protein
MTNKEFNQAVAYLSNPNRQTFIEAELIDSKRINFENKYLRLTNNYPLPTDSTSSPYFVWRAGTNKWSVELRIYFIADENIPQFLNTISTSNTRYGYEKYNRRINRNTFIYDLFARGFVLGDQITGRIN